MVVLLILMLVTNVFGRCNLNVNKDIPKNAIEYKFVMYDEVSRVLPELDEPYYFGSLIEHESCISLCSKRCWSPKSRLKTKREEGAGLAQLTRAYRKDGSLRFDIIASLKKKHPKELSELTWDNVYDRPDLQIRAMSLLWRDNYRYWIRKHYSHIEAIRFADSQYNGGLKYLNYEIRQCKLRKNCDPHIWFGNVELQKSKRSRRILYGNRTAWDINRHHVEDVIKTRLLKYENDFNNIDMCPTTINDLNLSK